MFSEQLKFCLTIPVVGSSAGEWLLIIYNKCHYDSNYVEIKFSDIDILLQHVAEPVLFRQ
jgi:hypothetical protein